MTEYFEAYHLKQALFIPDGYVPEVELPSRIRFYRNERLGIKVYDRPIIIPSGTPLDSQYAIVYGMTTQDGVHSIVLQGDQFWRSSATVRHGDWQGDLFRMMPVMLPASKKEPAEFDSLEAIANNFGTKELWGHYCIAFRVPLALMTQAELPGRDVWMVRFDRDIISQIFSSCIAGEGERVAKLLEPGWVRGDIMDEDQVSALMMAAVGGSAKAVQALIQHGAIVNYADPYHRSAIFYSAQYGTVEAAGALCQCKANPDQVDDKGNTPLIWSAIYDQGDVAGFLSIKCIDKLMENNEGKCAIEIATEMGNQHVIDALT